MASVQFDQWIKKGSDQEHFVCIHLQVSRSVWESTFLPRCLDFFRAERTVRITSEKDWNEMQSDLCQPSLFSSRTVVLLEDVPEKLAVVLWEEKRLRQESTVLYVCREAPGKRWLKSVPVLEVAISEHQWLETLIRQRGRTIDSKALGGLVRLWRECNLKPEDIEQWLGHTTREKPIALEEVTSFFERSEKILLFGFLDALCEKNLPVLERHFQGLMKIGFPPPLLLNHLARRFRLILQIIETDEHQYDLWRNSKLSPYEYSKISRIAHNFSSGQTRKIFSILSSIDWCMKTQGISFEVLMLDLFTELSVSKADQQQHRQ